ncbi:hypothetical protein RHGRI_019234 [Rhododendron griersonianum]|uniref:Gcp-like domain-containing protein n=1 Tax=Rhododendron griersonianum TaxID=479676 RepID=A0AAV6JEM8_9ERIC|nr:hypothetical protein RHGRI_019234 [Rhododendron griersonianum]
MVSLVPTIGSTISRLPFLPKLSFYFSFRALRTSKLPYRELTPTPSPLSSSSAVHSMSNSNSPKLIAENPSNLSDNLVILGIETSCDDTAAAVVRSNGEILSQVVSSQVVQEALDKANVKELDLSAVAVTIGPGLSLCLRGGHNLLILARDLGQYVQLGTTIDDAIGEAYDKTAKWLGLDLRRSGGPAVEELAREGDAESVKFSVPMKQHKDCNFSYAGLKTQVRLAIESRNVSTEIPISSASSEDRSSRADIAASFQRVAVLHLEERCERAVEWALKIEPSIKYLVVSGGVASNQYVRARLNQVVKKKGLELVCPPPSLCTDNGVMIAWTGIEHFRVGRFDPPPPADEAEDTIVFVCSMNQLDLRPRWPLGEEYAEGKSEARSLKTARIHPSLTSMIQASLLQQS